MNILPIEHIHRFVWERLYDDRTGMFYNHLAEDAVNAAQYLPEPETIRQLIPNPAGYGTGMEDCMLNSGIMMDAVISQYEATGDSSMRQYAERICRGMVLDATVSSQKGFLPRGVSPVDCQSHYIDTSRDQYTNWWFGAYRFFYSELSNEQQRSEIRRCLIAMAEKFEADVIPENDWNFLREDGKIGMVGQMWGDIHLHEYLRLPMLYLLTWKTTQDLHWKELYLRYRDEAVEKTLNFIPLSGASYVGLQLQYAVRTVYELDETPLIRHKLLSFMQKMAEPYEKLAISEAQKLMTAEGTEWLRIPYTTWQNSKYRYAGYVGGHGYFVPEPSDFREHQSYYPLRAVGEGIAVAGLCPCYQVSDEALQKLCDVADSIDYSQHRTCAPIALLAGYWRTLTQKYTDAI